MKPIWFLDIDGVINAVPDRYEFNPPKEKTHRKNYSHWELKTINGYPINYSPEVIEFINGIQERINVRMLTTWKQEAIDIFAPQVGLNVDVFDDSLGTWSPNGMQRKMSMPAMEEPGMFSRLPEFRWWKMNVILKHIEDNGSDFVWSDDDIHPTAYSHAGRVANFAGIDNLIIVPKQIFGLEPTHLDLIEKFVSKIEAKTAK